MADLKSSTYQRRLDAHYASFNKLRSGMVYKIVQDIIHNTRNTMCVFSEIVRPCYYGDSGQTVDKSFEVRRLLDAIGIEYEYGQDGPKRTSKFIKIKTNIIRP